MRASDKAYAALRDDIIEWRLLPGTVLAEVEQSERLGISRTPLREALSRLTAEGLTTTAGGRGVVVTDISLEDIDELFELRETLEGKAAALAAERGDAATFEQLRRELLQAPELIGGSDPARHDYYGLVGRLDAAIDAAISNSYLAQAMRSLRVHLVRVRRLAADDARAAHRRRRRARRHRRGDRRRQPAAGRGRHHASPAPQPFPRQSHAYTSAKRSTMVKEHHVRVYKSEENLPREDQLAWKIAEVAADPVEVDRRGRRHDHQPRHRQRRGGHRLAEPRPVVAARAQALTHGPTTGGKGATVFGIEERVSPEWAAWANGVAVRELDYHDTFLAAEYSHPGDNIPPILAVAQHVGSDGQDLVRGIATGYEIQVDLVRAICLHKHKIDHVAHLGPSAAAGIGTLLGLDVETIYQAVGQALHTTTATRQSRKGEISTWKAHAPAFAGKMAVEAVDRAMRGETSPSPIYEGEDGVIAWLLDGPDASYTVPLPDAGEAKRAILDTYTKEHSAEYQAQAWIDLARKLHGEHPEVTDPANVESVLSHQPPHALRDRLGRERPAEVRPHGLPRDARPLDPVHLHRRAAGRRLAPRRLLRPRARRPAGHRRAVAQGHHGRGRGVDPPLPLQDIAEKAFGGRVVITLTDGTVIVDEIAVADAHPLGARPFAREHYIRKFRILAAGLLGRRGDRAVPRPRRAPARADRRRARPAHHHGGRRRARPRRRPKGLF